MTEETRQKLNLVDLTAPPDRPYSIPIPKDGTIYDYKFIKEVSPEAPSYRHDENSGVTPNDTSYKRGN